MPIMKCEHLADEYTSSDYCHFMEEGKFLDPERMKAQMIATDTEIFLEQIGMSEVETKVMAAETRLTPQTMEVA